jgi:peptidoglycan-associated lipoprotein
MRTEKQDTMYAVVATICVALSVTGCTAGPGLQAERETMAGFGRAGQERLASKQQTRRDRQSDDAPEVYPLSEDNITGEPLAGAGMLTDEGSLLSKRNVYYDYNDYTLHADYHDVIQAHAQFLHEHPAFKVRIEGNCDERGSSTYNLALGQRRADFVKRALELLGADAKQITAVSLGAERPKALGGSDAARAQNRRSDLKYIGIDVDYLHRPYR